MSERGSTRERPGEEVFENKPDYESGAALLSLLGSAEDKEGKLQVLSEIASSPDALALLDDPAGYEWRDYLTALAVGNRHIENANNYDLNRGAEVILKIYDAQSVEDVLQALTNIKQSPDAIVLLNHPDGVEWRDRIAARLLDVGKMYQAEITQSETEPVLDNRKIEAKDTVAPEPTQSVIPTSSSKRGPGFSGMNQKTKTGLGLLGAAAVLGGVAYKTGTIEKVGEGVRAGYSYVHDKLTNTHELSEHGKAMLDELNEPITEPVYVEKEALIADDTFVHEGSKLNYPDILYRLDRLSKEVFNGQYQPDDSLVRRYTQTARLLTSAKALWPQATQFTIVSEGDKWTLKPLDWHESIKTKEVVHTNIVVVGGELESVVTAIEAADKGLDTAIVYARPLGGLSADSAGNMRFFDAVTQAPETAAQHKLLHDALGMSEENAWSLPDNISQKITHYLQANYPQIKLISTHSYNSLHVEYNGDSIVSLTTDEGTKISGLRVIDTDPESRIAEKVGVPMNIEMPNMSYGLVFDVKGLTPDIARGLANGDRMSPQKIFELTGVTEEMKSNEAIRKAVNKLERSQSEKTHIVNDSISYGYSQLGNAFHLYMVCREFMSQDENAQNSLHQLNNSRNMGGFNVAYHDGAATLNSISYNFQKAIRQHDHSIRHDAEFQNIRDIEMPYLQQFLQQLSGSGNLEVVMPNQLYVRQAAVSFDTLAKYTKEDMVGHKTNLWMKYGIDVRGAVPRDTYDTTLNAVYRLSGQIGQAEWDIKPSTTYTNVSNLYLNNKSASSPEFVGNLRIIQNLMSTGVALVDNIAAGKVDAERAELAKLQVGMPKAKKQIHVVYTTGQVPKVRVLKDRVELQLPR